MGLAYWPRVIAKRVQRQSTAPLLALLLFAQVVLLGPLLWSGGLPKGIDMTASLVTGYEASNGSWHQLWDDAHFPGKRKHVSRFTSTELGLTWLTEVTRSPLLSMRLMVWAISTAALAAMYLLAKELTGSWLAGALAGIVYVFNRGALLNTGIPLAAGYALAPLIFLAVHRTLAAPTPRRTVQLGLVAGLFVTATIPGFTYIVGLAIAVYVAAFYAARLVAERRHSEGIKALTKPSASLMVAAVISVILAAYYVAGLYLSTAQLIRQEGGYDAETLSQNLPTYGEAMALSMRGFRFGTLAMDIASWALAAVVVLAAIWRVDWRVVALVIIASGSVFFAANVTSPAYRFLLEVLPFFSMVRGPARWLGLALLAYSLVLAIGLSAALRLLRAGFSGPRYSVQWLRMRAVPLAIAVLVVGVVVVNAAIQLPGLRRWTTPYPVPGDMVAPFREVADSDPGTVFATSPLLAERITGEPFVTVIDFGRTLGPAVSGRSALGGFRAGGVDVRSNVWDMLQEMRTPDPARLDGVVLSARPARLSSPVTNLWLSARVQVSEVFTPDGYIQVRFQEQQPQPYYAVTLTPGKGTVELARVGREQGVLTSAVMEPLGARDYFLQVIASGSTIEVWIDGQRVLRALNAPVASGSVSAVAEGVAAELAASEVAPLRPLPAWPDATFAKLLGLFNAGYVVVQPHASITERSRVSRLPGVMAVGRWGDAALYENEYSPGSKVYATQVIGLYAGEPEWVVASLLHLDALARGGLGLIGVADIPSQVRSEILSAASFVAAGGQRDRSSELAQIKAESPLPVVYVMDLSVSGAVPLTRPYSVPESLVVTRAVPLLPRARNFVLEATLAPVPGADTMPGTSIAFRVRDTLNRYVLELDEAAQRLAMVKYVDGTRMTIAEQPLRPLAGPARLRLSALEGRFRVHLDGSLVMAVSDDALSETGPVELSADAPGVLFTQIGAATDRDAVALRQSLDELGFDIERISEGFPELGRDHFGLFPDTPGFSGRLRGVLPGTYRVMAAATGTDSDLVLAEVHDGTRQARPVFTRTHRDTSPVTGMPYQTWYISEPVELAGGQVDVFVALSGSQAEARAIMLAEASSVSGGRELVDALLSPPASLPSAVRRLSPSRYTGEVEAPAGGLIVLRDAFDRGWAARLDGQGLTHLPVYGSLNGFWASPATPGGRLEIEFRPQRPYRVAMLLSAIAFLAVLAAASAPRWRPLARKLADRRRGNT